MSSTLSTMFFQLQLNEFLPSLTILIGNGGNMYVKLVDIGVLLCKSNPYAYRNLMKHFAVQGKDILSTVGFKIPPKTLTSHYVPIVLAYKFIMSEFPDTAKLFQKQLQEGIAHKNRMRKFVAHEKKAPLLLCVWTSDDKCVSVPLWIEQFIKHLERYRLEVRKNPTTSNSGELAPEPGPSNKKKAYSPLIDLQPPENPTSEETPVQAPRETTQEPPVEIIKVWAIQEPPVEFILQDTTLVETISQDTIQ
ncbi:hypothetical protein HNY73_021514 [Argiope bruennichi]|uniref:Uncharacterized protein n=1 Tax=Argiope bruennichi TaxID=94029 RepID=A0A8T0DZE0_ARGBR|nr:hypothetical protein HNY73_021514 [Argiope bruennichi]